MTDDKITPAGSPEDETEAAGGEDIYGADGDAGTARTSGQEEDTSDSGTTATDDEDSPDAAS